MPGALSLWLLSLCARKEKVTRRKGETSKQGQYIGGGMPAVTSRLFHPPLRFNRRAAKRQALRDNGASLVKGLRYARLECAGVAGGVELSGHYCRLAVCHWCLSV
jgi:hypothetical protein